MTRINVISPDLMTNNQLLAEYRELPRVINKVSQGKLYKSIPSTYRMGQGHESFFGDKLLWLHRRHQDILSELKKRSVECPHRFSGEYIIDTTVAFNRCKVLFKELCNDWTPTEADVAVNMNRLIERQFLQTKVDRYCDRLIRPDFLRQDWANCISQIYRSARIDSEIDSAIKYWSQVAKEK